jgi:hypothetical protein
VIQDIPCIHLSVLVDHAIMATEKQLLDTGVTTHVQDITVVPKHEHSVDSKGDVESSQNSALPRATDPIIAQTPKRTWRSYIWDSLDKDPKERKLVFKLDCALLTIGCLGYFVSAKFESQRVVHHMARCRPRQSLCTPVDGRAFLD